MIYAKSTRYIRQLAHFFFESLPLIHRQRLKKVADKLANITCAFRVYHLLVGLWSMLLLTKLFMDDLPVSVCFWNRKKITCRDNRCLICACACRRRRNVLIDIDRCLTGFVCCSWTSLRIQSASARRLLAHCNLLILQGDSTWTFKKS